MQRETYYWQRLYAACWRLVAWVGMYVLYRRRWVTRRLLFLLGVMYVAFIWSAVIGLARAW